MHVITGTAGTTAAAGHTTSTRAITVTEACQALGMDAGALLELVRVADLKFTEEAIAEYRATRKDGCGCEYCQPASPG